jgi:hypothetical protein
VTAEKDWWLEQEEASTWTESRRSGQTIQEYKTYQCDPGNCAGGNCIGDTESGLCCKNGRTGPACSRCPENFALEPPGVCQKCPDLDPEEIWRLRTIFCCAAGIVALVLWFLLSWSPVFKGTAQGFFVAWFGWPIRLYKKAKACRDRGKKLHKTGKKVYAFFTDPKNLKLFQQYVKIVISYLQVLGSFTAFKVKWPSFLGDGITWVQNVSDMIKIDLLTLPRLTCVWATFGYENKFYVTMFLPLVVDVLLVLPVLYVRMRPIKGSNARRTETERDPERQDTEDQVDDEVDWNEETKDVFWNNFMFWNFLIYPGTSLAVMQTFICRKVGLTTYLTADPYGAECPWGGPSLELSHVELWEPLTWISLVFIFVYPIGVCILRVFLCESARTWAREDVYCFCVSVCVCACPLVSLY